MTRNTLRLFSIVQCLLILFFVLPTAATESAENFDPVFEWTEKLQNGKSIELAIQVSGESITFCRSQATNLEKTTYQKLLQDIASESFPACKFTSNGNLVLIYDAKPSLRLEEIWEGEKPKGWRKVEFLPIHSCPSKSWPTFVRHAIPKGLKEYEVVEYKGEPLYSFLTFQQEGPASLRFVEKALNFSDTFYEYMKVSSDFKPRGGKSGNFIIIVHEPHWLVSGQYQLISGLRALLEDNSQYKFKFLVEGYFEKEMEDIPTKPILGVFSKSAPVKPQIFSLLRNFLIDGPLGYRLLYAPNLPALAIDDLEAIKKTPREPVIRDLLEQQKVFESAFQKLENFPEEKAREAFSASSMLLFYIRSEVKELQGENIIHFYQQTADLYDTLADCLDSLSSQSFQSEISFLRGEAENHRTLSKIFQAAIRRDATMASRIMGHFESTDANRIPVVFIGNFHTPGIIKRLPKDIGYVVIEPHLSTVSVPISEKDMSNFNNALNRTSRTAYLNQFRNLKLAVAPLSKELPFYESFLKKEAQKIKSQKEVASSSSPLSSKIMSMIENALGENGNFNNASIAAGGGNKPPPPPFGTAFASFSLGPQGREPAFILYDRKEENWRRSDRLAYLSSVPIILPYEKLEKETRKAYFHQDNKTKRMFAWIHDPNTQTFYFFEITEGIDLFKLLPLPRDGQTILMRLSTLEPISYTKEEMHG